MFRFLRDLSNKIIEKKEVKIGLQLYPSLLVDLPLITRIANADYLVVEKEKQMGGV